MTDHESATAADQVADGDRKITEQGITRDSTPVANATTDYGEVFTCVLACSGRGDCAWRPYECRLIGDDR